MARVVLAMSGGVDSSVAAWLLREAGHEVVGLFMRHGQSMQTNQTAECDNTNRHKQGCCTAADAEDARRVAGMLDIPFFALNFEAEFDRIIDYFVEEYTSGRTPNPCIVCNTWLKFGKLFEYANGVDAEYIATGHYARLAQCDGQMALHRGCDEGKDQSYVLFGIPKKDLSRLLFPVGEHRKEAIRSIAERLGFRVASKRDSQEICFVPNQNHARFIKHHPRAADTSGDIVTTEGTVVGQHDGLERFTIGQRKGLGIALGEPHYVVRLETETHRVIIGMKEELARKELIARGANWLIEYPSRLKSCQVKIRYRSRPMPAQVEFLDDSTFRVLFHEPCYAIAPGQAAVCYDGDRVLGGGWID